jgi:ribosomal-protein-alanine N-acetyltransferase
MIQILNLKKEDIEAVVEIEKKLLLETIGYEMLANELHNKYAHFYVAKKDDEVLGYIGGWIIDTTCDMINFVVKEEYQRLGIGTKLYKTLENKTKELNAFEILLEVRISNTKAQNFYYKNGFKEIFVRPKYYKNGEDALILRKELYEDTSN